MFNKLKFTLILISCLFTGLFLIRMYLADIFAAGATSKLSEGDYTIAIKYASSAIDLNPAEPNYYRTRARAYLLGTAIRPADSDIPTYKLLALADLKKAYDLNRLNLVTIRNLIPLYSYVASKYITVPAGPDNVEYEFVNYAKDFYDMAFDISPNDVGVYALLAKYQKRLGLTEDYEKSVGRIKELRPDLLDWYLTE